MDNRKDLQCVTVCVCMYLFGGYVVLVHIHHYNRIYDKKRDTQHDVREVVR